MNFKAWLKRLSAIILAACLFLPMSQCTYSKTEVVDGKGVLTGTVTNWVDLTPIPMNNDSGNDYDIEALFTITLIVSLFVWPLIFEVASYKYPKVNQSYLFLISELLLLCATAYVAIYLIFLGQRVAYGAYVFAVSATTYASITLIDLKRRIALTTQSRGPSWKN